MKVQYSIYVSQVPSSNVMIGSSKKAGSGLSTCTPAC